MKLLSSIDKTAAMAHGVARGSRARDRSIQGTLYSCKPGTPWAHTEKEAEACWCVSPTDYSQTETTSAPEECWIAATRAHSAQRVFNKTKQRLWLTASLFKKNGFFSGVFYEQQFVLKVFLLSILATGQQELFFFWQFGWAAVHSQRTTLSYNRCTRSRNKAWG